LKRFLLLPLVVVALACGGSTPQAETPVEPETYEITTGDIQAALDGPQRSEADRARDRYRHPAETLAFFGLEPSMTVVEVWPGGAGWYTKILAPVMRDHGRLILGTIDPEDERRGQYPQRWAAAMAEHPEVYDQVERSIFHADRMMEDVPDGSVDLVLSFRSAHNWIRSEGHDPQQYVNHIARVLRPGGVFGIVQHRAPADHPEATTGEAGYVSEELVISWATNAGLVLDERSEINANPADTHDHPNGVWSLPPSLRDGDESLREVGESDRMTLRFRKPETATAQPAPEEPAPEPAAETVEELPQ